MVTVYFSVLPGYGHFIPLRPLADALTRAGCDVTMICSSGYADVLRSAGYPTIEVQPAWTFAHDLLRVRKDHPAETPSENWSRIFAARSAETILAMTRNLSPHRPDLFIHDDHDFAGSAYGECIGSFRICVATTFRSPIETQRLRWQHLWTELRERIGLKPDPDMHQFWGQVCIDTLPDSFQPNPFGLRRTQDLLMNPISPDVAASRRDSTLRASSGGRNVGISFGTVYQGLAPSLDRAKILLEGEGFYVAPLKFSFEPTKQQHAEFPQLRGDYVKWLSAQDIIVCHGGRGTLLDCLSLGIPVVCVPMGADQAYNAFRVASLGAGVDAGRTLDVNRAVVEGVRRLRADDLYRRNADRLSQEIRQMSSADDCVAAILCGLK